jgi:4-oxalomesaconate tautomerase
MPCVILNAADFGLTGQEPPEVLEANTDLRKRVEEIRLAAGPLMNLGDVTDKSIPKVTLVSPPTKGGAITTRTFIPHRCHKAVGVLGAVSVATACLTPDTVADGIAQVVQGDCKYLSVEHPTGEMTVVAHLQSDVITRTEVLRTARKLMDGLVF